MQERPPFIDQLQAKWDEGKSVCVGLDPDPSKLPPHIAEELRAQGTVNFNIRNETTFDFISNIVNATADLVCAYKPNIAFYEDLESVQRALSGIVRFIHAAYPDIPVIGDVKRADIGNTNLGYARMAFERYDFDAITTNPYFGHDTYSPFLEHKGRGLLVLCKTSNPGATMYQDTPVDIFVYQDMQTRNGLPLSEEEMELAEEAAVECVPIYEKYVFQDTPRYIPLYQLVALRTATLARQNSNIGLVVGATHPESFAPVRRLFGDGPILIPGIGTQGGDLEKTLQYAPNSQGHGIIINSASKILFASSGKDFADAARAETLKLHQQITALRRQSG